MTASAPVDLKPQFQGLVYQASSLTLQAKAHQAMDEPYEAAVAWVEAGRAYANLGSELVSAGHVKEGAQDLLAAASCFLEAGDHRPADQQLEHFEKLPQLQDVIQSCEVLAADHKEIYTRSEQRKRALDAARAELQKQMGHPLAAHRLKDAWLQKTLAQLPGVPDLHWVAARKNANHGRTKQALAHYQWCVKLRPENADFWDLLTHYLQDLKRWDEARATADDAVARFPDNAFVRWYAGITRFQMVIEAQRPKSLLAEALEHFRAAIQSNQLPDPVKADTMCLLSSCLRRLGHKKEAKALLTQAVRDYPAPISDLAWRMLRITVREQERLLGKEIPKMTQMMLRGAA